MKDTIDEILNDNLIEGIFIGITPEQDKEIREQMRWLASAEPCGDDEPGAALYYAEGERMLTALRWPTYEDAVTYLKSSGWPCMKYICPDGYKITYEKL